jgi:phage terminase small subunit
MEKTLTAREDRFKELYLITLNATQSAKDAGFADSTAETYAPMWVGKSREKCPDGKKHVWDAVQAAKLARSERTQIDADFVLTRLAEMINADPCDILDEETGAYKRIHDWPIEWRRMLSATDVKELFEANAAGKKEKIGELVKFKFIDKLRAYELLGKHINVQAFTDKKTVDLTNSDGSMTPAVLDTSSMSTTALKELLAARDETSND